MKRLLSKLNRWFFPNICCFCREVSELSKDYCPICYAALPWFETACYRCGAKLETENEHLYCHHCQEKPPPYDKFSALFYYQPPIPKLITRLKFSGSLVYGRILGEMLSQQIPVWYQKDTMPQALIPVPLSQQRLRKRGYNQSIELARPILHSYSILPLFAVCKRIRHTLPQSKLNQTQRRRNLKNVFKIVEPKALEKFQHVVILDDVVTTGSTVVALAKVLSEFGIPRIDVICCARA